jgi:ParB-like chromosome segregation protein Spo0J
VTDTERRYQLLPPLTGEERQALRESIAAIGVLQPVVVDETGAILDGHHRAEIADELGVDCPATIVTDLSEGEKLETALVLNLSRRHLDAEQKRALVLELRQRGLSIRWISERTGIPRSTVARQTAGVPDGTPDRVTGLDGKHYTAVRRPALHDEYAEALRLADDAAEWAGIEPSAEERLAVATRLALQRSARELMRTGECPEPPLWWVGIAAKGRTGAKAQSNRLAEWDIRAKAKAGGFLDWCDVAGIKLTSNGWDFAERLHYPRDGERMGGKGSGRRLADTVSPELAAELEAEHGPEWEDDAVVWHWCCWLARPGELAEAALADGKREACPSDVG